MAKTVVALEITQECVRAAEVTLGRTPFLTAYGEVPLPEGVAEDSEVLDPGAVALAIKQLWSRAGIKGRRVVLGIGNRRVLVREHRMPALRPEHLRDALPFQVQDLLPVPVDQAVLDFAPTAYEGDQVTGLLVAAVSEMVEQLIETLNLARIVVDSVDLVPFGLARAARRLGTPGETVAMVHVGDHTSFVVVALDGIPQFVRIIPIDLPTAAVRSHLVEVEQMEEVLETVPADAEPNRPQLRARSSQRTSAGVDPAVADLAARVRSTLGFHADRPQAAPVTSVFVTGAGAAAPGLLSALELAVDARIAVPSVTDIMRSRAPIEGELGLNLFGTVSLLLGRDR